MTVLPYESKTTFDCEELGMTEEELREYDGRKISGIYPDSETSFEVKDNKLIICSAIRSAYSEKIDSDVVNAIRAILEYVGPNRPTLRNDLAID